MLSQDIVMWIGSNPKVYVRNGNKKVCVSNPQIYMLAKEQWGVKENPKLIKACENAERDLDKFIRQVFPENWNADDNQYTVLISKKLVFEQMNEHRKIIYGFRWNNKIIVIAGCASMVKEVLEDVDDKSIENYLLDENEKTVIQIMCNNYSVAARKCAIWYKSEENQLTKWKECHFENSIFWPVIKHDNSGYLAGYHTMNKTIKSLCLYVAVDDNYSQCPYFIERLDFNNTYKYVVADSAERGLEEVFINVINELFEQKKENKFIRCGRNENEVYKKYIIPEYMNKKIDVKMFLRKVKLSAGFFADLHRDSNLQYYCAFLNLDGVSIKCFGDNIEYIEKQLNQFLVATKLQNNCLLQSDVVLVTETADEVVTKFKANHMGNVILEKCIELEILKNTNIFAYEIKRH